jgi:hypothetical protein
MQRGTVGRTRGFDILYQFGETGGVVCNVVRWVGQGDLIFYTNLVRPAVWYATWYGG